MGVHGLWELLAPVGRRVSVETLAGKRLAIDASIWMIQFMKAMREEKGEMVRNAHLLGFFRRICKLMYLRTKPVFVFDGGTPALKRRTVIARRRQRENAQAKIRKTAEKLLLNHVSLVKISFPLSILSSFEIKIIILRIYWSERMSKVRAQAMRLKELAEDLENQRKTNDSKGKSVVSEDTITVQDMPEGNGFSTNIEKQQNRDDLKGKKVVLEDTDALEDILQGDGLAAKSFNNQEEIDEMLAASLAAEDDESFFPDASTSGAGPAKDEDDDEDEEMILPEMQGKIDPSILASLPPSMQLDLLVQMRERLMAENRQKYQKVKKAPEKFSELQIQAYLKTVAFRREIDEVQKSASGKGIGGVKISRIASEANREFIFSSSFTGDKQVLTSAGENQNKNNQMETSRENNSASMVSDLAAQKSSVVLESFVDEPEKDFHDDVETYLDERGRVRVSRSRAMGIRMTRDLQRNLDLMKEIEQERVVQYEDACNLPTVPTFSSENANAYGNACEKIQNLNSSHIDHEGMTCDKVENAESLLKSGTSLEISFEDKQEHNCGDDDDLFASLVGGDPIIDFSVNDSPVKKQSTDSASDVDWEEGVTEEKFGMLSSNFPGESEPSLTGGGGLNDESEVVWEEGPSDIHKGAFLCPSEGRNASKGDFEEEADFQEAIRRSLQDLKDQRSVEESSPDDLSRKVSGEGNMGTIIESDLQEKYWSKPKLSENEILHQPDILSKATTHFKTNDATDGLEIAEVNNCLNTHLGSEFRDNLGQGKILNGKVCSDTADTNNGLETHLTPPIRDSPRQGEILTGSTHSESHLQDLGGSGNLNSKILEETCIDVEGIGEHMIEVQGIDTINEVAEGNDNSSGATLLFARLDSRLPDSSLSDAQEKGINKEPEHDDGVGKREESFGTPVVRSIQKDHLEFTAESLVEEMLILGEERKELGDEQRRLERNAESVTSEMFSECQELLQMFGLPYIIAPMEAEAQCAYMELVNLVDGVVTDDSDAFLFGARSVYKNIFDDRKYVETYLMKLLRFCQSYTKDSWIRPREINPYGTLLLLLGSDYTEGVSGIGIVNAIEVLNAFPEEDGLHKFREWVESPDPTILGKIDGRSHAHHGNDGFSAYDTPQVDKSTEPFSWGKPDVSVLRNKRIKKALKERPRKLVLNWFVPQTQVSLTFKNGMLHPRLARQKEALSAGQSCSSELRFIWAGLVVEQHSCGFSPEMSQVQTPLLLSLNFSFIYFVAKIRPKYRLIAVGRLKERQAPEVREMAAKAAVVVGGEGRYSTTLYKEVLPFVALVAMECINVGLNTLFKAATNHGMNNHVFIVYAYAVAAVCLLPAPFFSNRSTVLPPLNASIMLQIFLLGVIGCTSQIMGYTGINYSSPTLASAISNLVPAFTFILALIFRFLFLSTVLLCPAPSTLFRSATSRAKVAFFLQLNTNHEAVAMGVILLGDTLYLGSIIGATIIAMGFYTVLWGKAQEQDDYYKESDDLESPTAEKFPFIHLKTLHGCSEEMKEKKMGRAERTPDRNLIQTSSTFLHKSPPSPENQALNWFILISSDNSTDVTLTWVFTMSSYPKIMKIRIKLI
nr:DNA repair protein UVH3 isoform X1 [Ipomoea batatas]